MAAFPNPALEIAEDELKIPKVELTLVEACLRNDVEMVKTMLESGDYQANKYEHGFTPLLAAIQGGGGVPILQLLVEYGAQVSLASSVIPPVLHFCIMRDNQKAFEFLLDHTSRTSGWAAIPPYLKEYKDIHKFMAVTGFQSPKLAPPPTFDPIVVMHEFEFSGDEPKYPYIVTEFVVDGYLMAVKFLKKQHTTGVFVGLCDRPGVINPSIYEIKFSYIIRVARYTPDATWISSKSIEGTLTEKNTDWGVWEFERHSDWFERLHDTKPRQARIIFTKYY